MIYFVLRFYGKYVINNEIKSSKTR